MRLNQMLWIVIYWFSIFKIISLLNRSYRKQSVVFFTILKIGFNGSVSLVSEILPFIQWTYVFGSEESFLLLAVNLRFCLFDNVSLGNILKVRFQISTFNSVLFYNLKLVNFLWLEKCYLPSRDGRHFLVFWFFINNC